MAEERAFTVGDYGSTIELRDGQWLRDGVPFEPDPPPISDDLTAMLVDPAKITRAVGLMGLWRYILGWDNFWHDFGGAPFTARTFPG